MAKFYNDDKSLNRRALIDFVNAYQPFRYDPVAKALFVASVALYGQGNRSNQNYDDHYVRVGFDNTKSTKKIVAGLLHDVVEDSDVSLQDLTAMNFRKDIIDIVEAVTKEATSKNFSDQQRTLSYFNGMIKIAGKISAVVLEHAALNKKMSDNKDNMGLWRDDKLIKAKTIAQVQKYYLTYNTAIEVLKGRLLVVTNKTPNIFNRLANVFNYVRSQTSPDSAVINARDMQEAYEQYAKSGTYPTKFKALINTAPQNLDCIVSMDMMKDYYGYPLDEDDKYNDASSNLIYYLASLTLSARLTDTGENALRCALDSASNFREHGFREREIVVLMYHLLRYGNITDGFLTKMGFDTELVYGARMIASGDHSLENFKDMLDAVKNDIQRPSILRSALEILQHRLSLHTWGRPATEEDLDTINKDLICYKYLHLINRKNFTTDEDFSLFCQRFTNGAGNDNSNEQTVPALASGPLLSAG